MYPVPPPGLVTTTGQLAYTGATVGLAAFLGVAIVFFGLVLLRAATVRLDPDARR